MFLTCARIYDADVEAVSEACATIVEYDVSELADIVKDVNETIRDSRSVLKLEHAKRVQISLAEIDIAERESAEMLSEDKDSSTRFLLVELVRPPLIEVLDNFQLTTEELIRGFSVVNADLGEAVLTTMAVEFRVARELAFETGFGQSFESVVKLKEDYAAKIAARRVIMDLPGDLPQGGRARGLGKHFDVQLDRLSGRHGASEVDVEWTPLQHRDMVRKLDRHSLRRVYPTLIAALVQDARARWGIRPDNEANRMLVSHHMHKQCRNNTLCVSAVDTHVALAVVQFFVPQAHDVLSRGMAVNWRSESRWSAIDSVIGGAWAGRRAAPAPVV